MSDNVTRFPSAGSDMVWICQCGCSTFYLVGDGSTECAACNKPPEGHGGWSPPDSTAKWDGPEPVADVQGNGSEEFARRRISNLAKEADAVALVVVREGGTIHAWSSADSADRIEWVKQRLTDAADLLAHQYRARDDA